MLVNNFELTRNRNNKPKKGNVKASINWNCAYNKIIHNKKTANGKKYPWCKASITFEVSTERINHFVDHTVHFEEEPLLKSTGQFDILADEFHNKVKIRAQTEQDLKLITIYQQELDKLSSESGVSNQDLAGKVKLFERMVHCLNKRRRKLRPKLPQTLREIILTEQYPQTLNAKQKFLIVNKSQNKILVFASPTGIEIISKAVRWHI